MSSLGHYYGRAKQGLMGIDPKEATELAEDWMIAGAAGAGLGLISASIGGLDKSIAGMSVPVDGLVAAGLAVAGLTTNSKQLKTASIAAGGSAATRTFEKFFKRALNVHGEIEEGTYDLGFGHRGVFGGVFGQDSAHDQLVAAAKYL